MSGEQLDLADALHITHGVIDWLWGMSGGEPGVALTFTPDGSDVEITYVPDAALAARTLKTLLFVRGLA